MIPTIEQEHAKFAEIQAGLNHYLKPQAEKTVASPVEQSIAAAVVELPFVTRARILTERGIPVAAVAPRTKKAFQKDWEHLATSNLETIRQWAQENPDANTAAVARAELGGFCFFEVDRPNFHQLMQEQTGQKLPATFTVSSSGKGSGRGHFYFKHTPKSIALGNAQATDDRGELWSFRSDNRYVVGPGSVHPDGPVYTVITDAPIADCPDWLVEWISQNKSGTAQKTKLAGTGSDAPIPKGQRNTTITRELGKARQQNALEFEALLALARQHNQHCEPPLPESELETISRSIAGYEVKPTGPETVILDGIAGGKATQQAAIEQSEEERRIKDADEFLANYDKKVESHSLYAMTRDEFELEAEKDFPVFPLPPQPGPAWDDSILYGAAGQVIKKASQYNESHPAGMLVDFLVSIGSVIGRGPYFNVTATRHYCNEFMARVGPSSTARKGGGRDTIDEILKLVDPEWHSNCIESGFGSGEAIIGRLRDASVEMRQDRKGAYSEIKIKGVSDKRLCVREDELASVFVLASGRESRADIVLRNGWDSKPLRNNVKGRTPDGFSNSAKCEEPHLSISGDTTVSELRQKMPPGADENGFGNRFLYVYVYRTKHCPQGGPQLDWSKEILEFRDIIKFAKTVKHVSMSDQARKWWNRTYPELEANRPKTLAGKMTARASAHIRRIAMLYALLDFTDQIELEHFHAAKKLWDYCDESAMYIFDGLTKEQFCIVGWIGKRGTASFNDVRDGLYHRNKPVSQIRGDLEALVKNGHLFLKNDKYATGQNVNRLN